jgi:choline kinase
VLGWQLEALQRAGIAQVTVVAGYRADDVVEFCRPFGDTVSVVVNSVYDRTNNMFSLRLALQGRESEETLISNGDVVFDPDIAHAMIRSESENLIAVEPGRYIDESMKVSVSQDGRITALSKAIPVEHAYGVSIDFYRFSGTTVSAICRTADRMIGHEGNANLWTEVAIDAILPDVPVHPFDIGGRRWIEIDNFTDLAEGERLFAGTLR